MPVRKCCSGWEEARIVWSCGLAARGRHRYANVVSCWGRVNELTFLYCIITFGEGSYIYVKTIIVYEVGIEQTCTNPVDGDVMTITIMYIGQCCSSVRANIYIWCVDMNIVVALLESKAARILCLSTTDRLSSAIYILQDCTWSHNILLIRRKLKTEQDRESSSSNWTDLVSTQRLCITLE